MNRTHLNRRRFLRSTAVLTGGLVAGPALAPAAQAAARTWSQSELAVLPFGNQPAPVPVPHFPSRLHAFVWRNWSLVPVAQIAMTVGAKPGDIRRLGEAMGLGKPPRVTRQQQHRSYITVIRRNWHLLPYDQLLALLDWTPQQLAYTLREDDFLFVKLGNAKPKCDPIRWAASHAGTREREAGMARVLREEFADGLREPADPLFGFVARLSRPPAVKPATPRSNQLRYCYSYFALYGDPLLEPDADPYPDGYLAQLAAVGVTGVWLQAVLHKLAPCPWDPARSVRWEQRLASLRALIKRAQRHGIGIYLYLNEPRALPLAFFEKHPDLKGVTEGDHAALCTSVPAVREFLSGSVARICREAPDLGGFFTISASENFTNCWSHGGGKACPRCGRRAPAEVIAEVNGAFHAGIQQAGGSQRLIVWDWGWADAWAPEIIARLPAGVSLMSVSEWSLPIERGGIKSEVGEYSISAVGPGPRAQRHWELARRRGLPVLAKIQAGNTWELSSVPYIPALSLVAEHAANLRKARVDGLMLGWTLGGYPSPNLAAVAEVLAGGDLATVARRRFGEALAPAALEAWRVCGDAFREFPYHGGVVYSGPQHNGPSNLLWAEPTGYHATMVGLSYDDLDGWRAIYPPAVFIAQLEKVVAGFTRAAEALNQTLRAPSRTGRPEEVQALRAEADLMSAAGIHWQSAANQARFVVARNALAKAKDASQAAMLLAELERLLRVEIRLACELHGLQSRDSRLGFEASNHYFYVPMDLAEKVLNGRDLLERWLPAQRARWAAPKPS